MANPQRRIDERRGLRRRARPLAEVLEGRQLLAVVTSVGDSGPGSLRQAILDTNASPTDHSITFNITPTVVTEFPTPTGGSGPQGITAGPDGSLWFAERRANQIGRITTAGAVTEFPVPTPNSTPLGITAGPDGNLWFTETTGNKIGRITTAGAVTEFPGLTFNSSPTGITTGPDGNLWFTEDTANKIGRITTAGAVTEFQVPFSSNSPSGITAGPDGNLWFTELSGTIGRITTAGVITLFPVPTPGSQPQEITAGPDGNLWFTELLGNRIGRITTAGVVTEFPVPTPNSSPAGITTGPDGSLRFTESTSNQIGRITTAGVVTESPVPTPNSFPTGITTGPDGNLWFTEFNANQIGRLGGGAGLTAVTISPLSALPQITQPVTIDGTTQPGYSGTPLIELNGAGAGASTVGLQVAAAGSGTTIRGLVVNRFGGAGIELDGLTTSAVGGNTVVGNYVGTNVAGTAALGNQAGIVLVDSANNTIGGATAATRNVVSGNTLQGIVVTGTGQAAFNTIQGNYVGTAADGLAPLGNGSTGIYLIPRFGSAALGNGNLIAGNVIAANLAADGVSLSGTTGNLLIGNIIGLNASGAALGNAGFGLEIAADSPRNTIGGVMAGTGNVISANTNTGVVINAANTVVLGNRIGTNLAGAAPRGNAGIGVFVNTGANLVTIGGTAAGAGNVISSNSGEGVFLLGASDLLLGNLIGTNLAGTANLGNRLSGVTIGPTGAGAIIGGSAPFSGNLISGNGADGISIDTTSTTGSLIQGNRIGTNLAGNAPLGNIGNAVAIAAGSNNTIGGSVTGAGNVLSGNGGSGVFITGPAQTGNLVQGNSIGTDIFGTASLGNTFSGVVILGGATGNAISANAIANNRQLGIDLGADGVTRNDLGDGDAGSNALQNFPVLTSAFVIGTNTTIQGTLNSRPGAAPGTGGTYRIELFSSNVADPSGFGQGQQFLGNTTVTTDAAGNGSFRFVSSIVVAGQFITATATSVVSDQGANNTSEFSAAIPAIIPADVVTVAKATNGQPAATAPGPMVAVGSTVTWTYDVTNPGNEPLMGVTLVDDAGTPGNPADDFAPTPVLAGSFNVGDLNQNGLLDPGEDWRYAATGVAQAGQYQNQVAVAAIGEVSTTPVSANAISHYLGQSPTPTPTPTPSFVVVNTNDAGPGSLRQAILNADQVPGSTITFAIPASFAGPTGYFTIAPLTPLPAITARTTIDGISQDFFEALIGPAPLVQIDGSNTPPSDGLVFGPGSAGSVLQGLSVFGFVGNQVDLASDNDAVVDAYLGIPADPALRSSLSSAGRSLNPGSDGVLITGAGATVGGTTAAQRNVISGNRGQGVEFRGPGATGVVLGNYIGTDPAGSAALGNLGAGVAVTLGAGGEVILSNVISGNDGVGIELAGSVGSLVMSNYVGTDAAGTHALGNLTGICLDVGSIRNFIGGTIPFEANVVSGNRVAGVAIQLGSDLNSVLGNRVGTDAAGANALGNGIAGILVLDSAGNIIGPGNLVSGNGTRQPGAGIWVDGPATGRAAANMVFGNFVGTDATGTRAIPNTKVGILVNQSSGNLVGGSSPGLGNLVSGNSVIGIMVSGPGASGNTIQGNLVGTDASGAGRLGNGSAGSGVGIYLVRAGGNAILGNTASANLTDGIELFGPESAGNLVQGNRVGTDPAGDARLGNGRDGVVLDGAPGNRLVGNIVSANGRNGFLISGAAGNLLQSNLIGLGSGGEALGNGGFGVVLAAGSTGTAEVGNLVVNNARGSISDQSSATATAATTSTATTTAAGPKSAAAKAGHPVKLRATRPTSSARPIAALQRRGKVKAKR